MCRPTRMCTPASVTTGRRRTRYWYASHFRTLRSERRAQDSGCGATVMPSPHPIGVAKLARANPIESNALTGVGSAAERQLLVEDIAMSLQHLNGCGDSLAVRGEEGSTPRPRRISPLDEPH